MSEIDWQVLELTGLACYAVGWIWCGYEIWLAWHGPGQKGSVAEEAVSVFAALGLGWLWPALLLFLGLGLGSRWLRGRV